MKVNFVGFRDFDNVEIRDDVLDGTQLFFLNADPDGYTVGFIASKAFIKNRSIIGIDLKEYVGKEIDIEFGMKNKIVSVSAV